MRSMAPPSSARLARNIATTLTDRARTHPFQSAVVIPRGESGMARAIWSYKELDERSAAVASGLHSVGLERGARAVLMVPPSLEFFALVFALFRAGIVPVVVDPGMGIRSLKRALAEAQPQAFIGVPRAHAARVALGWARDSIRVPVTTGCIRFGHGFTLRDVARRGASRPLINPALVTETDVAAILFTSGSTGPPKGVVYTHNMFAAQIDALRSTYAIEPGEVDLCTFPLFALFAPALGMTAVVPPMDPTRPGKANPRKVLTTAKDFAATNFFGSPALIKNVGTWGVDAGFRLPELKRAISAGAPVPARTIQTFARLLRAGVQVHTPYGATEALPVTTIASDEILGETHQLTDRGHGVCVGRTVTGIEADIIRISDAAIPAWSDDLRVQEGEVGEIVVRGANVTREYHGQPEATRLAKILMTAGEGTGEILHRMGDLGWRDVQGRLWFCGRKSQRVILSTTTLHTIPCEAIFNLHPRVRRTALVGVKLAGGLEPVLCVETSTRLSTKPRLELERELASMARGHAHTQNIRRFVFRRNFPVDARHNAKIGREKLGAWAARRLS